MKINFIFFSILCIFALNQNAADQSLIAYSDNIVNLDSFKYFYDLSYISDKDTLVIFDLDTLLESSDLICKSKFHHTFLQLKAKYSPHVRRCIKSLSREYLIERDAKNVINELKANGITVLCLTDRLISGNMPEVICSKLLAQGINFNANDASFWIPKHTMIGKPLYHKGIIFTDGEDKNRVLSGYLKQTSATYKKIIVFDRDYKNLSNIDYKIKKLNKKPNTKIDFLGYHYTYLEKSNDQLNKQVAEYQFNHFAQTGNWWRDEGIIQRMNPAGFIQEIQSFSNAEDLLVSADQNSLVFFDLDETLIESTEMICKSQFQNQSRQIKSKYKNLRATKESQSLLTKKHLIEPNIINIILDLQARRIKTFGLTARHSNQNTTETTYSSFCGLGIDFFDPSIGDFNLINIQPAEYPNSAPVFYKGIIFTDASNKGYAVYSFLKHTKTLPKKIILFDDNYQNLIHVKAVIDSINHHCINGHYIEFYGYHFTYVEKRNYQLDVKMAEYQFEHLSKTQEWLCDEELKKGYFTISPDVLLHGWQVVKSKKKKQGY
ncbi:MAG: DUF2608 domain-containing protein [Candidatus Babeliales bacterium]|nr:DUF2608 domain-containing protein [Candidatus Babeliales bacterium]